MSNNLRVKIETWKKLLLDLGKRNRLINFRETKRSNIKISQPSFERIYDLIVIKEKEISFPFARKVNIDEDGEEKYEEIVIGDVETTKSLSELQKTLKVLRYRSRLSVEEQGINTLYLTFGLLKWKEAEHSSTELASPLILVPVRLTIESLSSPYKMELHEDEVVVNPTLAYKLYNDFGIKVPHFDNGDTDIEEYCSNIDNLIKNKGWELKRDVNLTLLSFLKINMYKDLERNEDRLHKNPIISAIVGDGDSLDISEDYNHFDHDTKVRPIDTYQVVDADSSQMDAILLSKNGFSFVLQGPPGTGKSQTITNIIAEALADGKKILFVSEKMAALKVVHKRLHQVGLSDFCLTLHSHKANKKEILQDLSDSINQNKTRVRDEIISQLDTLERRRNALNDYSNELHTKCRPMGWSVYDVNGKLAKLKHIPDIVFGIDEVNSMGLKELNNILHILAEYSRTIGKKSEDYSENPWRNATISALSYELRHDIDANLSVLISLLKELDIHHKQCRNNFGLDFNPTINNSLKVKSILSIAGKCPIIPEKWILSDDIEQLRQEAVNYKAIAMTAKNKKDSLLDSCDGSILMLSGQELELAFSSLSDKLMASLNTEIAPNKETMVQQLPFISKYSADLHNELNNLYSLMCEVCVVLGMDIPNDFSQLKHTVDIIGCISHGMLPTKAWFDKERVTILKQKVREYSKISSELILFKSQIDDIFDKEIYTIDYYSLLKKFRSEYNSILRVFKLNYWSDIRFFQSLSINGNKLSYKELLSILNKLKTITEHSEKIKINKAELISLFGNNYNDLNTDWNDIDNQLNNFERLFALFGDEELPIQLLELYELSNIPYKTISIALQNYNEFEKDTFNEKMVRFLSSNITECSNLSDLLDELIAIGEASKALNEVYNSITDKLKSETDYNSIVRSINDLTTLQQSEKQLIGQKALLEQLFAFYFQDDTTNWDALVDALVYGAEFKAIVEENKLSDKFIKDICSNKCIIEEAKFAAEKYNELLDKAERKYHWFISLFDSKERFSDKNISDLITRFVECRDRKSLLEEWIDYRNNRDKCMKIGLSEYINQVESLKVNPDHIIDSYMKRFYRLWLDAIIPNFPAVQSFRSSSHEQIIDEFKYLDSFQQKIAQSRIRERVLRRMPDFNSITASHDEIGTLKRELNKQRRIMPLRKLFNSIPNLLTSLRPCFMMSPLSVSVFLEAQSYDFDIIIFDEASQVCTEDAIGAIMRGKQIIIVGDNKQLPPTSFFSASLNDGDHFDTEVEEDTEVGAYESILDEALKAIPERSLLWHYRSKHEHLIAFSNYKIYNKRLITFPSCDNKSDDVGVEYIYVKDGIYDRGGKRNNINEAMKVADMVFDHFMKYPNRSLGVVTFSEAQQHAVETAITKLRIADSRFDHLFSEEAEEPFFVKNLENVQGDERDTIIFSIGYAKDGTGREMAMNLGPLSRDGGERRLNVAITRAKFNVKLVGSIQPHDLDLERTNAAGVKLLRAYVEFAQQGMSAINHEANSQTYGDCESPFEEAVYDYLTNQGYDIDTQVGCSGYRIDMAIKHPQKTNRYILGIECDGASYHSSRTARERDRLRQEVLENMGWKIHRVWSTDWIKDPVTEGEKIINAINIALHSSYSNTRQCNNNNLVNSSAPIDEIIPNRNKPLNSSLGFDIYEEANIYDISRSPGEKYEEYLSRLISHIITTEQPIHFDIICKRMAPEFRRQKASSVVKKKVNLIIQRKLKEEIIVKENFYQLKSISQIKVRIPGESDETRQIQYVSNEEICEAMMIVAANSYGIKGTDLTTATARALGYSKSGINVIAAMNKAYKTLIHTNRLREIEGKANLS